MVLNGEPGADRVTEAIPHAAISAVNVAEVVAKLQERGISDDRIGAAIDLLELSIIPLDQKLALDAGLLRVPTRAAGLSLGDRACLALAAHRGATALTADRAWGGLNIGIEIELAR